MWIINRHHVMLLNFLCVSYAIPIIVDSDVFVTHIRPDPADYFAIRQILLHSEENELLGANLRLNSLEIKANKVIMNHKKKELMEGFKNPDKFLPGQHIFKVLHQINESEVYNLIRTMPKGGVLHAHDTALLSTNKIIEFTYRENLWMNGNLSDNLDIVPTFLFHHQQPPAINETDWVRVTDLRMQWSNQVFDQKLKKIFSLFTSHPEEEYKNIDVVWRRFMNIFQVLEGILCYDEVWKAYFYQALQEFLDDGVQYLEFRGVLPKVYSMNGTVYSQLEVAGMYVEVLKKFKQEHPTFIGSKFIFAPIRSADDATFDEYLQVLNALMIKYPSFVAGFDLVGQEDNGRPLKDFVPKLLELPLNVSFYFHAGETDWNGLSTDENLIDAILLGTKRIGHGYALTKHPQLIEIIKERDICVEVNPISNQVLKLVDDFRNHPAAILFSNDYPVVVSSDDPSFWNVTPLSHDFYMAFMGIASAHSDIRFLKQLALNSINYSSLNDDEKELAIQKWKFQWQKWLLEIDSIA